MSSHRVASLATFPAADRGRVRRPNRAVWIGLFIPLLSVPLQAQPDLRDVTIHVGPNHRASPPDSAERNEGWIAASLRDPNILLAASHKSPGCGAMISRDAGNIWENLSLPRLEDCFDPMTASSSDGVLYILSTGRSVPESQSGGRPSSAPIRIYSSVDSGKTWRGPAELRTPVRPDHPRLTVDRSNGSHHGRVYVAWNEVSDTWVKNRYNIFLHYSDDSGRTFSEPIHLETDQGGKLVTTEPVVLSDGTLLVTYYQYYQPLSSAKNERQPFYILRSTDGGETFAPPEKVLEVGVSAWNYLRTDFGRAFTLPIIVADGSRESPYTDRLYVVWDDVSEGDSNIWLTWSADGGRTWAARVKVNDNHSAREDGPPDFRMTPVVAVNQAGVVGVAWYDRRDDPARRCWKQYFSASIDGGVTFQPNIAVSSAPSCPGRSSAPRAFVRQPSTDTALAPRTDIEKLVAEGKFGEADRLSIAHAMRDAMPVGRSELRLTFNADRNVWPGHYTGLTSSMSGAFHALWADRREGLQYMYTARIDVTSGQEVQPTDLEEVDATDMVQILPGPVSFDEDALTSEIVIQIRNVSTQPLYAPLQLRVVRVTSSGGREAMRVIDPDSGGDGDGATWDFSSLLGTQHRLDPNTVTAQRTITLRTNAAMGLDASFQFEVVARRSRGGGS